MKKIFFVFTVTMAILLLLVGFINPVFADNDPPITRNTFAEIVEKVSPAVVSIHVFFKQENGLQNPQNPENQFKQPSQGGGSGFLVSANGIVITNNHVVDNATGGIMVLVGEEKYPAKIIGKDAKIDIAMLKIEPKNGEVFQYVSLADSDKLKVGQFVVVIGSPFGLDHTVTVGVVSAKDRNIGIGPYDEFIQTDAAINRGNSGGPMFNIDGKVVGMNTAIFGSGERGGNLGLGFAVPSNIIKKAMPDLKETGHVVRGWLGIALQKITPDLMNLFLLTDDNGVLITEVFPNGPAAQAGLKHGDVVTSFDGEKITPSKSLPKLVAAARPGTTASITIWRNGKEKTLQVLIGKMDIDESPVKKETTIQPAPEKKTPSFFGMTLSDIPTDGSFDTKLVPGVYVQEVMSGSLAEKAGIKKHDVIIEVYQKSVKSLADFQAAITSKGSKESIPLLVFSTSRGFRYYVSITP
jgi:serine protease Do